jgi:hypothetical protein
MIQKRVAKMSSPRIAQ